MPFILPQPLFLVYWTIQPSLKSRKTKWPTSLNKNAYFHSGLVCLLSLPNHLPIPTLPEKPQDKLLRVNLLTKWPTSLNKNDYFRAFPQSANRTLPIIFKINWKYNLVRTIRRRICEFKLKIHITWLKKIIFCNKPFKILLIGRFFWRWMFCWVYVCGDVVVGVCVWECACVCVIWTWNTS